MTRLYGGVVAKVCYLFAGPGASFEDLYQETLINLWVGLDSFRGDSAASTWIYRMALNTCITWHRRNDRHTGMTDVAEAVGIRDAGGDPSERAEQLEELRMLHSLISDLNPIDKAIITLWLEERPYEEIATITGLSKANVAVKVHRIKAQLVEKGKKL
ncbi:MAG: sigma-70 family RNA polymerase sigma factor [Muribaculaceae bacterium]|nr:sigma-70 family RNA polymerase sigma factor [Muribaculaceae bacterium]